MTEQKFKVGDRVRVLPGGVDGDHGGITDPLPLDTTVMRYTHSSDLEVEVKTLDGGAGSGWYVPEEFLVSLEPDETVVWSSAEVERYEVQQRKRGRWVPVRVFTTKNEAVEAAKVRVTADSSTEIRVVYVRWGGGDE